MFSKKKPFHVRKHCFVKQQRTLSTTTTSVFPLNISWSLMIPPCQVQQVMLEPSQHYLFWHWAFLTFLWEMSKNMSLCFLPRSPCLGDYLGEIPSLRSFCTLRSEPSLEMLSAVNAQTQTSQGWGVGWGGGVQGSACRAETVQVWKKHTHTYTYIIIYTGMLYKYIYIYLYIYEAYILKCTGSQTLGKYSQ